MTVLSRRNCSKIAGTARCRHSAASGSATARNCSSNAEGCIPPEQTFVGGNSGEICAIPEKGKCRGAISPSNRQERQPTMNKNQQSPRLKQQNDAPDEQAYRNQRKGGRVLSRGRQISRRISGASCDSLNADMKRVADAGEIASKEILKCDSEVSPAALGHDKSEAVGLPCSGAATLGTAGSVRTSRLPTATEGHVGGPRLSLRLRYRDIPSTCTGASSSRSNLKTGDVVCTVEGAKTDRRLRLLPCHRQPGLDIKNGASNFHVEYGEDGIGSVVPVSALSGTTASGATTPTNGSGGISGSQNGVKKRDGMQFFPTSKQNSLTSTSSGVTAPSLPVGPAAAAFARRRGSVPNTTSTANPTLNLSPVLSVNGTSDTGTPGFVIGTDQASSNTGLTFGISSRQRGNSGVLTRSATASRICASSQGQKSSSPSTKLMMPTSPREASSASSSDLIHLCSDGAAKKRDAKDCGVQVVAAAASVPAPHNSYTSVPTSISQQGTSVAHNKKSTTQTNRAASERPQLATSGGSRPARWRSGVLDQLSLDGDAVSLSSGLQCSACGAEVGVGKWRISCAKCTGVNLCVGCFCAAVEPLQYPQHRKNHSYRVIGPNHKELFVPNWTADEELMLLEAIGRFGLGNWNDVAEAVSRVGLKPKSRQQCELHYFAIFIESGGNVKPFYIQQQQHQKQMLLMQQQAMAVGRAEGTKTGDHSIPVDGIVFADGSACDVVKQQDNMAAEKVHMSSDTETGTLVGEENDLNVMNECSDALKVDETKVDNSSAGKSRTGENAMEVEKEVFDTERMSTDVSADTIVDLSSCLAGGIKVLSEPVEDTSAKGVVDGAGILTADEEHEIDWGFGFEDDADASLKTLAELQAEAAEWHPSWIPGPVPVQPHHYSIQGFLPLRGDFEVEYDNGAELMLADMTLDDDSPPTDKTLKLRIIETYNCRLDERLYRRRTVLLRGLEDPQRQQMRKGTSLLERGYAEQLRSLRRFGSDHTHQALLRLLSVHTEAMDRCKLLREWKSLGLSSLADVQRYEAEKLRRSSPTQQDMLAVLMPDTIQKYQQNDCDILSGPVTADTSLNPLGSSYSSNDVFGGKKQAFECNGEISFSRESSMCGEGMSVDQLNKETIKKRIFEGEGCLRSMQQSESNADDVFGSLSQDRHLKPDAEASNKNSYGVKCHGSKIGEVFIQSNTVDVSEGSIDGGRMNHACTSVLSPKEQEFCNSSSLPPLVYLLVAEALFFQSLSKNNSHGSTSADVHEVESVTDKSNIFSAGKVGADSSNKDIQKRPLMQQVLNQQQLASVPSAQQQEAYASSTSPNPLNFVTNAPDTSVATSVGRVEQHRKQPMLLRPRGAPDGLVYPWANTLQGSGMGDSIVPLNNLAEQTGSDLASCAVPRTVGDSTAGVDGGGKRSYGGMPFANSRLTQTTRAGQIDSGYFASMASMMPCVRDISYDHVNMVWRYKSESVAGGSLKRDYSSVSRGKGDHGVCEGLVNGKQNDASRYLNAAETHMVEYGDEQHTVFSVQELGFKGAWLKACEAKKKQAESLGNADAVNAVARAEAAAASLLAHIDSDEYLAGAGVNVGEYAQSTIQSQRKKLKASVDCGTGGSGALVSGSSAHLITSSVGASPPSTTGRVPMDCVGAVAMPLVNFNPGWTVPHHSLNLQTPTMRLPYSTASGGLIACAAAMPQRLQQPVIQTGAGVGCVPCVGIPARQGNPSNSLGLEVLNQSLGVGSPGVSTNECSDLSTTETSKPLSIPAHARLSSSPQAPTLIQQQLHQQLVAQQGQMTVQHQRQLTAQQHYWHQQYMQHHQMRQLQNPWMLLPFGSQTSAHPQQLLASMMIQQGTHQKQSVPQVQQQPLGDGQNIF